MMGRHALHALFLIAMLVIAAGTVFFRYVEGWAWIDAWFFTVVTVSTVGYGDFVPHTTLGKIGAAVTIFIGIGIFALLVTQIGERIVARRVAAEESRKHHGPPNRNP
jgi:voltage-gated potassium channel